MTEQIPTTPPIEQSLPETGLAIPPMTLGEALRKERQGHGYGLLPLNYHPQAKEQLTFPNSPPSLPDIANGAGGHRLSKFEIATLDVREPGIKLRPLAEVLQQNDPRIKETGVIYVSQDDEQETVRLAIVEQEMSQHKRIAIVLPENGNKFFKGAKDLQRLKGMRLKTDKTQVVFIVPESANDLAIIAKQNRFTTYSSLESYAKALMEDVGIARDTTPKLPQEVVAAPIASQETHLPFYSEVNPKQEPLSTEEREAFANTLRGPTNLLESNSKTLAEWVIVMRNAERAYQRITGEHIPEVNENVVVQALRKEDEIITLITQAKKDNAESHQKRNNVDELVVLNYKPYAASARNALFVRYAEILAGLDAAQYSQEIATLNSWRAFQQGTPEYKQAIAHASNVYTNIEANHMPDVMGDASVHALRIFLFKTCPLINAAREEQKHRYLPNGLALKELFSPDYGTYSADVKIALFESVANTISPRESREEQFFALRGLEDEDRQVPGTVLYYRGKDIPEFMEDACSRGDGLYAIADGVTNSFQSRVFAKLLTEYWISHPNISNKEEIINFLKTTTDAWRKIVPAYYAGRNWDFESVIEQGAAAVFAGIKVNKDTQSITVTALGDCCFILVGENEGKPYIKNTYPIKKSTEFKQETIAISTRTMKGKRYDGSDSDQDGLSVQIDQVAYREQIAQKFKHETFQYAKGDRGILVTDALAHWLMANPEQIDEILSSENMEQFRQRIETLIAREKMTKDDATLCLIDLPVQPIRPLPPGSSMEVTDLFNIGSDFWKEFIAATSREANTEREEIPQEIVLTPMQAARLEEFLLADEAFCRESLFKNYNGTLLEEHLADRNRVLKKILQEPAIANALPHSEIDLDHLSENDTEALTDLREAVLILAYKAGKASLEAPTIHHTMTPEQIYYAYFDVLYKARLQEILLKDSDSRNKVHAMFINYAMRCDKMTMENPIKTIFKEKWGTKQLGVSLEHVMHGMRNVDARFPELLDMTVTIDNQEKSAKAGQTSLGSITSQALKKRNNNI